MDRNTLLAFSLSMLVFVSYVMYQEQRRSELALETEKQEIALEESAGAERSSADRPSIPPPGDQPRATSNAPTTRVDRDLATELPRLEQRALLGKSQQLVVGHAAPKEVR